jgi:hypothetical protein
MKEKEIEKSLIKPPDFIKKSFKTLKLMASAEQNLKAAQEFVSLDWICRFKYVFSHFVFPCFYYFFIFYLYLILSFLFIFRYDLFGISRRCDLPLMLLGLGRIPEAKNVYRKILLEHYGIEDFPLEIPQNVSVSNSGHFGGDWDAEMFEASCELLFYIIFRLIFFIFFSFFFDVLKKFFQFVFYIDFFVTLVIGFHFVAHFNLCFHFFSA